MEQRGREEVLLVENYAIVPLSKYCGNTAATLRQRFKITFISAGLSDFESAKRQYVKLTDAHGCMGILRVNEGKTENFMPKH